MKINTLLLFTLLMWSCDRRSDSELRAREADEFHEVLMDSRTLTDSETDISDDNTLVATVSKANAMPQFERKLVKNGSLSFETENIATTKTEIEKLCRELNGYIASENRDDYDERIQYSQVIRIPAKNFDLFIEKLESQDYKPKDKSINAQDVTEEFIDVEARLKTKKDLEIRYRELLKFAKTVPEMLSIENQIEKVRSEIESMEGRLNFLKNQLSFSTLTITYYEITGIDFGFASKFIQALRNGWDHLLIFLIYAVGQWPLLLALGSGVYILLRRKKKLLPLQTQ